MTTLSSKIKNLESKFTLGIVKLICKYYLKRPDQVGIIHLKLPTFKAIRNAAINELYFKFKSSRGYKLTTVNLEVTNCCNIKCKMCPGHSLMKRKKGFMSFDLFKKIIDETPDLEFILPFQWGEPLLHKDIFKMIHYASDRGIRTMLTSNAVLFSEDNCRQIIESGLTRITISIDGIGETYSNIRGVPYEEIKSNILLLKKMRDQAHSDLKIDVSMVVFKETEHESKIFFEEWTPLVDRVQCIPVFTSMERTTRCRELWRGTMVVLWDGTVVTCCVDYEGEMKIGNANNERISDIWNNLKMKQFRKLHSKRKFYGICKNCGEYESQVVSKRFQ